MVKWLITLGLVLLVTGLAWPLLAKIGLGQLPGDIRIVRAGRVVFYFPLTSCILLTLVLSLLARLFRL
jgi:hypothetical protein